MATRYFTAIIEAGGGEGYGVYFPDLPGCVSAGDTIEKAAREAEEALTLHLRGMAEDNETIPDATAPEEIKAAEGSAEVARFLVRGDLPSRPIRLNISLDEMLVAEIDRAAGEQSLTRSGFLAMAARKALEEA